jgi:uncharacterized membrane protein
MPSFRTRSLQLGFASAFALVGAVALGCSSDSGGGVTLGNGGNGAANGGTSNTGTGSTGTGNSANGATGNNVGTGGITITPVGGGGGLAGTAGGGNGTPEVCDGVDNDGNGIVDDVDVGNDGVCDCLQIATLGTIGPWSSGGNVFATWLNARSPTGAVALGDQELTDAVLAPFQVIVSLHVGTMAINGNSRMVPAHHAFSDAEAAAFKAWVEKGGGAMSTIGYYSDEAQEVVNVNKLLAAVGLGYSTTKLGLDGFVTNWMPHPVTMGVSRINVQNGVEPADMGTTLATGQNNALALKVSEVGQGKVVVWGDEWITYDSEWQDVTNQQVELFWVNILKWLSPAKVCQVPIPPTIIR